MGAGRVVIAMLKIEEDGHLHGGKAPRPWVAEIVGLDRKFGLAREFLRPLRDFAAASTSMAGRTYGVIAHFPLHEGRMYEVSRLRGKRKRREVREFCAVSQGEIVSRTADEAAAYAAARGTR